MKRPNGIWVLVGLAGLAGGSLLACDDEDGKKAGDAAAFLGDWTLAASNLAVTCTGFGNFMEAVSGSLKVTAGTTAPLVITFTDPTLAACSFLLDVSGATATVRAGQSCPLTYMAFLGTFTAQSGTMTVAGETGSLSIAGSFTSMLGTLSITCTGSVSGGLLKGLVDAGTPADGSPAKADTAAAPGDTAAPSGDTAAATGDGPAPAKDGAATDATAG